MRKMVMAAKGYLNLGGRSCGDRGEGNKPRNANSDGSAGGQRKGMIRSAKRGKKESKGETSD